MGVTDILKKKAIQKNKVMTVLATYCLMCFLMVSFEFNNAIKLDIKYIGLIFVKSTLIYVAWIASFKALKDIPISIYGVLNLSKIIFSIIWGIVLLQETLTINQIIGTIIIIFGLLVLNLKNENKGENENAKKIKTKSVILVLLSGIFSTLSGFMDKVLMKDITSGQLQFWFLLFLAIMYIITIIVKKEKIEPKKLMKNYWMLILAICLVIGDRLLFNANGITESKVSVMSLVKQLSVIITVIAGGIIFKEKYILYRLGCAIIVIVGVTVVVLN